MKTNFIPLYFLCIALSLYGCKKTEKSATPDTETAETNVVSKARAIHERVITIDTHNDFNVANFTDSLNYTMDLDTQVTLPKMKEGGLDVSWLIVYTGQGPLTDEGYKKAMDNAMAKFDAIHRLCEEIAPESIELAYTSNDVKRIVKAGKKVAMIGVENAYPLGTDLTNIKKFHELGARYMSLSHNGHSQFCDSNTGEKDSTWLYNGLSELGKEAVEEMNKWGIMIDVSHPASSSIKQMIELSKAPVIASHSSARALCDHSRNLSDEELVMIKENGGVVQTVALDGYLNIEKNEKYRSFIKEVNKKVADSLGLPWYERSEFNKLSDKEKDAFMEAYPKITALSNKKASQMTDAPPAVNVGDFVDHIDYMVKLIGIDHVGISSDFDGGGGIEGWDDASETFNVTLELVKRGYTEEDIAKLWGGNLLRVLDDVQKVAADLQQSE
ncbi:dipeptidase [Ascidiimonas aurantiaca]|uniref:dipeptidase n=1 Tax=Ascidiimonas aurantiaca TaxID=1685432 RepID=UPI0030EB91AE